MKGAVLALVCAAALVSAEINENGCPINPYVDILKPHPICNKFYQCVQGELLERKCASDLSFNVETQECDWSENVDCGDRPIAPESNEDSGNDNNAGGDSSESGNDGNGNNSNESGDGSDNNDNGNGNGDPSQAEEICRRKGSNGVLVAHEDCDKFYKCSWGKPVEMNCYSGLFYNIEEEKCDWPENVDCDNRGQGGDNDGGNGNDNNGGNGNDNNGGNGNDNNGGNGEADKDEEGNNNGGGNGDPSQASDICGAEGSDGVLVAHENCNQFYKCSEGVPVAMSCNSNLLFNYNTNQCDWPENVDCENRGQGGDNGNDNNGGNGEADKDEEGNNNNSGGNGDPSQAHDICAAEGSDGVLVAHENCKQFYKCSEGVPVAMSCNSNLLFNYNTNQCDWPENVDCENRGQGGDNGNDNNGGNGEADKDEEGNNNGGGNGNPSQAHDICAAEGSDGVLVAHENCNQFYKCSEGVPVAMSCNSNLLFNYNTNQCDWPENVDCENRGQGGDNGNDNNGGNGEADKDEEGNNNGGGNGNPSQAHDICAAEGSDGVLVAHENCNQFFKCSEGVPVAMSCNSNLLFNYNTNQCDWPENVDCENRGQGGDNGNDNNGGNGEADKDEEGNNNGGGNGNPNQAHDICAAEGSDGVLVAHENCNQFYKCSEGVPVAMSCNLNLLFNYNTNQCDWPENVDCENRGQGGDNGNDNNGGNGEADKDEDGNNNGGGNGDPNQASDICAAEGSDGVLVAHENCNQFYKCSEGVPVAMSCNLNLLFNYNINQCDWPENVRCENRGQGGNNGNGNNGRNGKADKDKEGTNNRGGNGDPSQAHDICAAEGSDGVLVAHENCNQFYKCSEGVAVAMSCNLNLLFNYNNNQCDWPENVDCENRGQGGDNGNDNNGGNGEADKDEEGNNNNSGGNGDPSQAREICAAEGSAGVLVAHENCNQFYMCSEGVPVAMTCNLNLLFNYNNNQCDWPENVDCGNRRMFTSLNKHLMHSLKLFV